MPEPSVDTSRTWTKVNGTHTSNDGYTLARHTSREVDRMCSGASYSGYRWFWVVRDPDGSAVSDYPGVLGGPTMPKAKEALDRRDRVRDRDIRRRAADERQQAEEDALAARVEKHTGAVLRGVGKALGPAPIELGDVARELTRHPGALLVKVRESRHGTLYALSDAGFARSDGKRVA